MSPLDLLAAFEGTNRSERQLRAVVDIIPAQLWFGCPDGTAEFLNQRRVAYTPGYIAVANARGMHEYANKRATGYVGTPLDAGAGLGGSTPSIGKIRSWSGRCSGALRVQARRCHSDRVSRSPQR